MASIVVGFVRIILDTLIESAMTAPPNPWLAEIRLAIHLLQDRALATFILANMQIRSLNAPTGFARR
jgi:hypothetical protein